jgi:hypothetical protein
MITILLIKIPRKMQGKDMENRRKGNRSEGAWQGRERGMENKMENLEQGRKVE